VLGDVVTRRGRVRARSLDRVWLVAFLALALLRPGPGLSGQVPDTVPPPAPPPTPQVVSPPDTAVVAIPSEQVEGDTVPDAIPDAAESTASVPVFPIFPSPQPVGWDVGRWTWGTAELSLLQGMTLLEFIERLPGFVAFRAGAFGRPAGLTASGMGGGGVRVRVDGFELDPHDAAAYPVETISLVDLSRVTVERSAGQILIDVESYRLTRPEPHSVVELGTGAFQTRVLRALFSRGFGERSVATGAFDLVRTGGIGVNEDYRQSVAAFRWGYLPTTKTGVEIEWRRTAIDRAGEVFPLQTARSDLIVRGRALLGERAAVEAHLGASNAENDVDDGDAATLFDALQGRVRGTYSTERATVEASVLGRTSRDSGPALSAPSVEAEARAVFRPLRAARIEVGTQLQSGNDLSANLAKATGTIYPFVGLSLFGSIERGSRLYPARSPLEAPEDEEPVIAFDLESMDVSALRGGAELAGSHGTLGVAALQTGPSIVPGLGQPFDTDTAVGERKLTALEAYFGVPLTPITPALRVNGWFTRWLGDVNRPYTPVDMGRVALTLHGLYIGGQFEPLVRIEGVRQGSALFPASAVLGQAAVIPAHQTMNFELRMRIIDVQAFILWDNLLLAQTSLPIANAPLPRPRVVYGASWRFRN